MALPEERQQGSACNELHVGGGILHPEIVKGGSWYPLVKSK